jgi:hypothetical protein
MDLAAKSAPFTDTPLRKIHRAKIEEWVKAMTTSKLAPGAIRTHFSNVRSVFRAAVRDRLIANDPSEGVPLPRLRRRESAMILPDPRAGVSTARSGRPALRAFLAVSASPVFAWARPRPPPGRGHQRLPHHLSLVLAPRVLADPARRAFDL